MNKTLRHFFKPLLGVFLAGLLGHAQASDEGVTIRIGSPDQGAGSLPFVQGVVGLAHIQQQLEQEFASSGVKVQWHFFKGAGPAVNEALANQQLDFAWLGDLAAIIGRSSGLQTRLLLGARGANMYLAVTPQSGITQLADLKGKRVAVYRGTADQLSFARALESQGLKERDLQIISLDWAAARAALASGQIDATWSGMGVLGLESKGIQFPLSTKQLSRQSTTQAGLVGTQAFIEQHPELTQRLIKVLVKNAFWLSDPYSLPEYSKLMGERSSTPAALFERELKDDDLKFRNSPRIDPFLKSALQDSVEQARKLGLIRRTFSVDEWVEPRFVEAAVQERKLTGFWPQYDAAGNAL
ncbi:Sulfate ester transport system substrate-binding protein [Pseudomonas cichorii]|uniref:Sulfate ester transport system substrate-binding protein n=1 Tax=Pseudomonas cichorii TaxID=36746 RepID=A0A3M4M7M2_PSECI|nr:ABC transporter substrate-binding protein [Pseudomonas cichorii]RMQ49750.1 Sulfate ester transport system substrate-binding protein [Pseudomonas cichorii]